MSEFGRQFFIIVDPQIAGKMKAAKSGRTAPCLRLKHGGVNGWRIAADTEKAPGVFRQAPACFA
jgi:hypothetical protein